MKELGYSQQCTCGGQEGKGKGKTDGMQLVKKARISHCDGGHRVEEVLGVSVLGDPTLNCPWSWKSCSCWSSWSRGVDALALKISCPSGRFCDSLCWKASRVLVAKRVHQVCTDMERLYQSCAQESVNVSNALVYQVMGLCHVLEGVPSCASYARLFY